MQGGLGIPVEVIIEMDDRYRGGTLWNILSKSYQVLPKLELFKEILKKDIKLLENIDFRKESCLLSNKTTDFFHC